MTLTSNDDRELLALRELSAALGADPLRTQGAGGNTSIKRDGILWIKASGTWLADALAHDIMTPVRLGRLREAIAQRDPRAAASVDFVDSDLNASDLRPSIETSVHAIIPSPIVVHIHCVNTIALAGRRDGESLVRERLRPHADVALAYIPYRKPGLPLAHAIAERLTKETNVLVLANHGLVVAGGTVAEVADRTARVCDAFSAPARLAPEPDVEALSSIIEGSEYRLPQSPAAHAVALDPKSLAIASRGSLYPDHVVFLGPGLVTAAVVGGRLRAPDNPQPVPMLALPGLGVGLHRSATKNAHAMARCLADVAARIPEDAPTIVLTAAEERELMNWEAETYRQSIAR
ncbi:MAG TPA: class II aldolase/adducin family protein [Roseiarcus sp.]|jgi:rhamnose utilization protein RhaD (predicted bifunctional aldolase and dehydrogenase)